MFANGPPWTITGFSYFVWTKLGFIASFRSIVAASSMWRSFTVIFLFSFVYPTTIFEILLFKSSISSDKHNMAMMSDAGVITKSSLKLLSFISMHLFIVTLSIPNSFPW